MVRAGASTVTDALTDLGPQSSFEPLVLRGTQVPADPDLSVCILVLERAHLALDCLSALRRPGGCPPGTEVVVVANGTPQDQLMDLAALEDIVLVVNRENLGFAGGCNQAASLARAPHLLFLNDDSTVEEGSIEALVRAASNEPAIGAVGCRITSSNGTLEEAGSVVWRDGSCAHVGEGLPSTSNAYMEPRDVDYASANGLLVTRRAWDAVGGFDERFFPAYAEDVDLCLRLSAHGFRVRYEPKARLVHLGSQGTSRSYREFLLARNQQKLVEKWGRALDRFEPPPRSFSRPERKAALVRAINRADPGADRVHPEDANCSPRSESAVPTHEIERLREDYFSFLEQRAVRQDRRITELETYIAGLWSVQLRCWVASRLEQLRYRVAPRRH